MDKLIQRLDILLSVNQISNSSYDLGINVLRLLEQVSKTKVSEENAAMLMMHMVMANERMLKQEPVEALDPVIYEQLVENPLYKRAVIISDDIIGLVGEQFIEDERGYIIMHLLNFLGSDYEN